MKKRYLVLALIPFLAACGNGGNKGNNNVEPIPVPTPEPVVVEDAVYIGFLASKAYDPNNKVSFTVSVEDDSIVTYSNKTIFSNNKSGSTVIHFVSDMLTYNVTVTVQDDYTVPSFTLDDSKVIMNTNKDYNVVASLTYRGLDALTYSNGLHVTNETNTGASTVLVEGNTLKIHGNKAGKDTYTVYTTAFEHTLSRSLSVEVKDDNSIVIAGNRLTYSDDGPVYNVSMYKYSEDPIDLKEDLSITNKGTSVDYSAVTVTSKDTSVVSIVGSVLTPHKSGKTSITVSCGGVSTDIEVNVFKPVIAEQDFEYTGSGFSLDFNVAVDASKKQRAYDHIAGNKKEITLPTNSYSFSKVGEVAVDGKPVDASLLNGATVSGSKVSLDSTLFDHSIYGTHKVSLTLEESSFSVKYNFDMLFITKTITKYVDYRDNIVMGFEGDVINGYFVLADNIDSGGWASSTYCSGADKAFLGFRGTLDGQGHSINNFNATPYGLSICVGSGALIKNVTYNVTKFNANNGSCVLGRFIFGATFENVTINLPSDAITDGAMDNDPFGSGIFSTQKVNDATFKSVTIHAEGKVIRSLCGKNGMNNKYQNVKVYCAELKYTSTNPAVPWDTVEGIQVIKNG